MSAILRPRSAPPTRWRAVDAGRFCRRAGPVGAAAALSLARRGYPVILVDRAPPQPGTSAFGIDVRNVALSPRSASLLQNIDAWPEQAAAYHNMRVWEERGSSALDFDAASVNRQELGWLVEVGPLLERLWQRLEAHRNVQIYLGTTKCVTPRQHGIVLTVEPAKAGEASCVWWKPVLY